MPEIDLQEHETSRPYRLSVDKRDALAKFVDVTPVAGESDTYTLKPGSTVGALSVGDLSVIIQPKLKISRVLYLASYAMAAFKPQEELFSYKGVHTLVEALARALASAARKAFARGLLHDYQPREEALYTVRGRIAFAEQIRRRFDVPLPVEVRYDDFTDDIEENRLVKAAASILSGLRIEDADARDGLRRIGATLVNVSLVHYRPEDIPSVEFDRLNEHYREVVELARLILRHASFESERGGVRASGFLIDMNDVFQEFVTRALREKLRLTEQAFPPDKRLGDRMPALDVAGRVSLRPDLSWWEGDRCVFVGDAKYKTVADKGVPTADLYQALAYATALDLPGALLAYAEGEADSRIYDVRHAGKRLEVKAVSLSGSIAEIDESIAALAERVRWFKCEALRQRPGRAA